MENMRSPKTIASAALLSLVSAASLPDTPHFYLYDLASPTIAVIDFHNQGISPAAGQTLTERFRLTLSMYTPYSVEASGIENRINQGNAFSDDAELKAKAAPAIKDVLMNAFEVNPKDIIIS
jgi:hypothetical protein